MTTKPNPTSKRASRPKAKSSVTSDETIITLEDYVNAFCVSSTGRGDVMRLSRLLANVVGHQLRLALPAFEIKVGERSFGGSVRRHHLDIVISSTDHGLQLGIDVKGLNSPSSVGKNWNNRVGDLIEIATNHHSKFPYAVLGGVLAIPFEEITPSTMRNIEKAVSKLHGRQGVKNDVGRMEAAALLVIDKSKQCVIADIPDPASPIRFERFVDTMVERFHERQG